MELAQAHTNVHLTAQSLPADASKWTSKTPESSSSLCLSLQVYRREKEDLQSGKSSFGVNF